MNLVLTCMFFSPIIPQAIPMCLISTIVNYWVSKYMLLRWYKMPNMFGDLMATFFANLMPWVILIVSIGALMFYVEIGDVYNKRDGRGRICYDLYDNEKRADRLCTDLDIVPKSMSSLMGLCLFFVLVCMICPIRSLIKKCLGKSYEFAEDSSIKYADKCCEFPADYERENPLTSKEGRLRLVKYQLDACKDEE